jgi:transcriptional regulator with XRE-family HTH domain
MNEEGAQTEKDFSWQEVGWRIRETRLARGMSQAQLATACNLSGPGIFFIEKGTINPQITSLQSIAKALGCSVRQLLTGSTEKRTEHDNLLEQMGAVLASNDQDAVLALLSGLQSAQLLLHSRTRGRRRLTVKPSEEILKMFKAAGEIDLGNVRYRLAGPTRKEAEAFRAENAHNASSHRKATPRKEEK